MNAKKTDNLKRFKIRAVSREAFDKVRRLVGGQVRVHLVSEKRLTLSTNELPEDIRSQVERAGASVHAEQQYDLEDPL